jgi:hypothetical protein
MYVQRSIMALTGTRMGMGIIHGWCNILTLFFFNKIFHQNQLNTLKVHILYMHTFYHIL